MSYNHFCPSFWEDNSVNLLQKTLQNVSGFNNPVAEKSSLEYLNERNKGKGAHLNKSLSYNNFCSSILEDKSANLLQKTLQNV